MPVARGKQRRTLEILLTAKNQTGSALRLLKQEVQGTARLIGRGFLGAGRAVGTLQRQIFNLRNTILLGAGAAMTKFAADFEDDLAQVASLIDDPRFDLSRFSAGVRDIAIATGDSFGSLNKALFDTVSAGVAAGDALGVLRQAARLAAAGGTETAVAVDGLTSLLNAYGLAAGDAARVTDALFAAQKKGKTTIAELSGSVGEVAPLARTLGVTLEELTAAMAALTTVGLSTDKATTQLKAFFAALIKPSPAAILAAEELGIELSAASVSGGRFVDFLRQLQDVSQGNADRLGPLFTSVEAFQGVLNLAKDDARVFADTLDAMANKAGSVDRAFEKTSRTLGSQISRTWRAIQASIIDVVEGLRPVIEELLSGVRGFFVQLAKSREEVVKVFGAIADVLLKVKDAIRTAFEQGDAVQLFVNTFVQGVALLGGVLIDALPVLVPVAAVLGRSLGISLVRSMLGVTERALIERAQSGLLGRSAVELLLGKDALRAGERKLERLKLFEGFVGVDPQLLRAHAREQLNQYELQLEMLQVDIAKLHERHNLGVAGGFFIPGSKSPALSEAEEELARIQAAIEDFRLLAKEGGLQQGLEEQRFGSGIIGADVIEADAQRAGEALEKFVRDTESRFKGLGGRIGRALSDPTKEDLRESHNSFKDLAAAVGKLSESMAQQGEEAGGGFAQGLRATIEAGLGRLPDRAAALAKSITDALRSQLVTPAVDFFRPAVENFTRRRELRSEADQVREQLEELLELRRRVEGFGGIDIAPPQLLEQLRKLEEGLGLSAGQLRLNLERHLELGGVAPAEVQKIIDKWVALRQAQDIDPLQGLRDRVTLADISGDPERIRGAEAELRYPEQLRQLDEFLEAKRVSHEEYQRTVSQLEAERETERWRQRKLRDSAGLVAVYDFFIERAKAATDTYGRVLASLRGGVDATEDALAGFLTSIATRTQTLSDAFKSMVDSILASLARLASQQLANQILSSLISIVGGALGSGGGLGLGSTAGSATGGQAGSPGAIGGTIQGGGSGPIIDLGPGQSGGAGGGGPFGPQGQPGGTTIVNNYYSTTNNVSAMDGQSVARFFKQNRELLAAQNREVMSRSPAYRGDIRKAAR